MKSGNATDVLYLRTRRRLVDSGLQVLVLHVVPPDGVAIRSHNLSEDELSTVGRLAGTPSHLLEVAPGAVDRVVGSMMPASLRRRLENGLVHRLVVIPDPVLWPIPWGSSTALLGTTVSIAQSLSLLCADRGTGGQVSSVLALIDDRIPEASVVLEALRRFDQSGVPVRYEAAIPPVGTVDRRDLLVV